MVWSNIWAAIKRVCQQEKRESVIVSAFENYLSSISPLRGSLGRSEQFLSPPFPPTRSTRRELLALKKRVSSSWERFLSSNGHLKLPFCNCLNHGQMCGMINDRRMHSYMCSTASYFYDSISEMHDVWCNDDRKWRFFVWGMIFKVSRCKLCILEPAAGLTRRRFCFRGDTLVKEHVLNQRKKNGNLFKLFHLTSACSEKSDMKCFNGTGTWLKFKPNPSWAWNWNMKMSERDVR